MFYVPPLLCKNLGKVCENSRARDSTASRVFTDLLSNSPKRLPRFSHKAMKAFPKWREPKRQFRKKHYQKLIHPELVDIYRGYYLAAWRYGFYLRVDNISHEWAKRTNKRCFQHKKIKSVPPRGHVIFFLLYEIFTVKRNKKHNLYMCTHSSRLRSQ